MRLGDNQKPALNLTATAPWGAGLSASELNTEMRLGPQRCLDTLERLCEMGLVRRNGRRFQITNLGIKALY